MSYTTDSGRTQILRDGAAAAAELDEALTALGDIYDHLDEPTAERMEQRVFLPLQAALAQLRRTLTEFASRSRLSAPQSTPARVGLPEDPRVVLERVADAAQSADEMIAELQDSMLPVEVGDEALRHGLSRTRLLIAPVPAAADAIVRTFGR